MTPTYKPQFSFDELYVPPFRLQRGLNPETLALIWVPFKYERRRTGVNLLDEVIDAMANGANPFKWANRRGVNPKHLSAFVNLMTGMSLKDFFTAWIVRKAKDLMLSTELTLDEVMAQCGYSDRTNFCRFIKSQLGEPPHKYRRRHSRPIDRQRYAL